MVEKVIFKLLQKEKKVVAMAKLNQGGDKLSLRYIRFQHKMKKVDRSRDRRSCDLSITPYTMPVFCSWIFLFYYLSLCFAIARHLLIYSSILTCYILAIMHRTYSIFHRFSFALQSDLIAQLLLCHCARFNPFFL